jgi:hypothetical protein
MANIRDNLSVAELSFVMAAEALAAERIEQEIRIGNDDCIEASATSTSAIRGAIEADRQNRQPLLSRSRLTSSAPDLGAPPGLDRRTSPECPIVSVIDGPAPQRLRADVARAVDGAAYARA